MPLLSTLLIILSLVTLLWLLSLALKDVSIVDIFWGCGFVILTWYCYLTTDGFAQRKLLSVTIVTLWGLRLAIYLFWRNAGKGEDYRYQAMRKRIPNFAVTSLVIVFAFQGLLIWLISFPLQAAQSSPEPAHLTWLDYAGALCWLIGLTFETVGDLQLAKFKADPANKGKVMDRGLWRYTRHPNYFGDALVWWGFYLIALSNTASWWTIISPLAMTTLLMKVSGVALLERSLAKTKPEYESYVRRTNAFIPWFPKNT